MTHAARAHEVLSGLLGRTLFLGSPFKECPECSFVVKIENCSIDVTSRDAWSITICPNDVIFASDKKTFHLTRVYYDSDGTIEVTAVEMCLHNPVELDGRCNSARSNLILS
jgi:hypothetical protein